MASFHLRRGAALSVLAVLFVALVLLAPGSVQAGTPGFYTQSNLVSDLPNVATFQDPNLVNAWGLSRSSTGPWWVSDNGTGKSTLYDGSGTPQSLVVTIPPPPGGTDPATPTGNVYNSLNASKPQAFVVSENGKSGPSIFIFATEDGTISGWNSSVDLTNAILTVDRSKGGDGAVYKGLALGVSNNLPYIYATNFRSGMVERFDAHFHLAGTFTDRLITSLCPLPGQCFAPFGIQNIGNLIYVTFALQDADKHDDVHGPGNGFVDAFDTAGQLVRRFAQRGALNSPWGLAKAPTDFGPFSNAFLVGNFGDGRVNAFDINTGALLGHLSDQNGNAISINGLWGIAFGNGASAGGTNELFFTAGLNDEANGLFGKLDASQ